MCFAVSVIRHVPLTELPSTRQEMIRARRSRLNLFILHLYTSGRVAVKSIMALSEKDRIVGIFQAVGALAERLTGEKLVVRLTDSEGNSYDVYADTSDTKWQRPSDAAASPLGDGAPRVDGPLADSSGRDSSVSHAFRYSSSTRCHWDRSIPMSSRVRPVLSINLEVRFHDVGRKLPDDRCAFRYRDPLPRSA